MKKIITILFVLIFGSIYSQEHSYNITEEEYDSLMNHSWYNGRVFLTDGSYVDGKIHRNFDNPSIDVKTSDGYIKTYTGFKCAGFYLVNQKSDSAFFLFLDLKNNEWSPEYKAVRLLIDGEPHDGISLLRYAWIVAEDDWLTKLARSDVYQIQWEYYVWKNGEIKKLTYYKKELKRLVKDKPETMKYYKMWRRGIKRGEYSYLANLINTYNLELYKL